MSNIPFALIIIIIIFFIIILNAIGFILMYFIPFASCNNIDNDIDNGTVDENKSLLNNKESPITIDSNLDTDIEQPEVNKLPDLENDKQSTILLSIDENYIKNTKDSLEKII